MAKQFTLGKNERVKSRKLSEQLFATGKKLTTPPFHIRYIFLEGENRLPASLQFGVGVSVRNFKKAADRNRIKRLTREAWRLQKQELTASLQAQQKQAAVFFIYTGRELPPFDLVKEKTAVALKKLEKLLSENNSAIT